MSSLYCIVLFSFCCSLYPIQYYENKHEPFYIYDMVFFKKWWQKKIPGISRNSYVGLKTTMLIMVPLVGLNLRTKPDVPRGHWAVYASDVRPTQLLFLPFWPAFPRAVSDNLQSKNSLTRRSEASLLFSVIPGSGTVLALTVNALQWTSCCWMFLFLLYAVWMHDFMLNKICNLEFLTSGRTELFCVWERWLWIK